MPSAPSPRPSTATERQKLIAEYEQSKRSETARHTEAEVSAARNRRLRRYFILGGVAVAGLYLGLVPPAWVQPDPLPIPSLAEQAASAKFAIFLEAQQIESFRTRTGRLPTTIAESGEALPGIDYIQISPTTYALQSARDSSIRYASTDSLPAFLGNSMTLLGRDQQQ